MRRFLKPGTVLSAIAVVLAMSGTAVAGSLITSKNIKDGTIKARDIHKGTITADRLHADVQRELSTTVNAGAPGLRGASGADGATGATGAAGADGAKGDTGAAGAKGDTGAAGAKGDKGDTGADGADGANGAKGDKGDAGEKGDDGLDSDAPRILTAGNLRGFTLAPKGDNGGADDNGTLSFDTPPVAPTLGTKSLKFKSTTGKPVVVYLPLPSGYNGATGPRPLLGEVTKASYGSLIHTQPQNALDIGLQFEVIKSKATKFASGYTTVVFEPYHSGASETLDEWHRHSVDTAKVWSTSIPSGECSQAAPCSFRDFREQNPYAEVLTAKLKIGQNSGEGWTGFEGYVDDLSFGFGPVTRYDFGG